MEKQIAVRFYENGMYGTTYAKGQYRKAVFNGTADIQNPKAKYLLDMYDFNEWQHSAKSDEDMQTLKVVEDLLSETGKSDVLATWIKRLDEDNSKSRVQGFGLLDMKTNELTLLINDEDMGVEEAWQLTAKPCRQALGGRKSPQLLATNADLN